MTGNANGNFELDSTGASLRHTNPVYIIVTFVTARIHHGSTSSAVASPFNSAAVR